MKDEEINRENSNRILKFIAWDNVGKYFHPGFSLQEIVQIMTTQEPPGIECVAYQFGFKDFVFQQYTGLKDKNGKEIYDQDILKDHSGYTWVVFWHEEHACFGVKAIEPTKTLFEIIDNGNMAIIGNIYENPELLK